MDRLHKSLRVSGKDVQGLAAELGVHRNTLSRYLSGRGKPDRRTLIAWALATGVPLRWLETGVFPGPDDDGGLWAPRGSNPQPTDYRSLQVVAA